MSVSYLVKWSQCGYRNLEECQLLTCITGNILCVFTQIYQWLEQCIDKVSYWTVKE